MADYEDDVSTENYDDAEDGEDPSPMNRMNKQIESLKNSIESQANVSELLKIPGVREALDSHQKGEEIEVRPRNDKQDPEVTVDKPSWEGKTPDEMNGDEFLASIQSKISTEVMEQIRPQMQEVKDSLDSIKSFVSTQKEQEASKTINDAKKKYSDFDEYIGKMGDLYRTNPNLNIDQLYVLAKTEASDDGVLNDQERPERISSERPTSRPSRPRKEKPIGNKRSDFSGLVRNATDKQTIDFGQQGAI